MILRNDCQDHQMVAMMQERCLSFVEFCSTHTNIYETSEYCAEKSYMGWITPIVLLFPLSSI